MNPEEGFQEQGYKNRRQGRNSMYECRYYSFLSVKDHFKYIYIVSHNTTISKANQLIYYAYSFTFDMFSELS